MFRLPISLFFLLFCFTSFIFFSSYPRVFFLFVIFQLFSFVSVFFSSFSTFFFVIFLCLILFLLLLVFFFFLSTFITHKSNFRCSFHPFIVLVISVCLYIYLSVYLSVCLFLPTVCVCVCVCVSIVTCIHLHTICLLSNTIILILCYIAHAYIDTIHFNSALYTIQQCRYNA